MNRAILPAVLLACSIGLAQSGPVVPAEHLPCPVSRVPFPVLRTPDSPAGDGLGPLSSRVLDTGTVGAFDIACDNHGRLWAAVAGPDGDLRILTSDDDGRYWTRRFLIQPGSPVPQVELVPAAGDSSFVFVFFLESAGDGDLWLARIADDSTAQVLPVEVGTDTIDDFSAACDRDSRYYLYCLYANERRTGRTGAFVRSVDFGRTWGAAADWWNGWDPHLSYTAGSTIHCAWRYALTGAEIHYTFNRHYGASDGWSWRRTLAAGGRKCWGPVVVQADSVPEWQAPVWVFFSIGRRDTSHRDLAYAYSPNNGVDWSTGLSFSDPYVDEWAGDLLFDSGRPGGGVAICYNRRGLRPGDATSVDIRLGSIDDPAYWTRPIPASDAPACGGTGGTRPRLVYPRTDSNRAPAVAWCGEDDRGLYISAPWLGARRTTASGRGSDNRPGLEPYPNPARGLAAVTFDAPTAGCYQMSVYDANGRMVQRLRTRVPAPGPAVCRWRCGNRPAGTYFLELAGPGTAARTRLVLLGPAAVSRRIP